MRAQRRTPEYTFIQTVLTGNAQRTGFKVAYQRFLEMLPDDTPFEAQQVIQRLLEYMIQNPEAKDTLEGIEQCWPLQPAAQPRPELVRRAMQTLVYLGWVIESRVTDRILVYSVSPSGLSDGAAYLERVGHEKEVG